MKKFLKLLIILISIIIVSKETQAQFFTGIRPSIANKPEHTLSVSIPIIPNTGISNFLPIGEIPSYINTITKLKLPDDYGDMANYQNQSLTFMEEVNRLYNKNIFIGAVILPVKLFGLNTRYFEISINGGVKNYTHLHIKGLNKEVSLFDIRTAVENDFIYTLLNVGKQRLLNLTSTSLLGGDLTLIGKLPINVGDYVITPLIGVGFTLAYSHIFNYYVDVDDNVSMTSMFIQDTKTEQGLMWGLHGLVGIQMEGFKYIVPRIVFQVASKPFYTFEQKFFSAAEKNYTTYNIGMELKVWKIAKIRAEVINLVNPEYKFEISRWFLKYSEAAIGFIGGSKLFNRTTGYAVVSFGGLPVRFSLTALTDGKGVGGMMGLSLGYHPL